jgi:hypothetical protein
MRAEMASVATYWTSRAFLVTADTELLAVPVGRHWECSKAVPA